MGESPDEGCTPGLRGGGLPMLEESPAEGWPRHLSISQLKFCILSSQAGGDTTENKPEAAKTNRRLRARAQRRPADARPGGGLRGARRSPADPARVARGGGVTDGYARAQCTANLRTKILDSGGFD